MKYFTNKTNYFWLFFIVLITRLYAQTVAGNHGQKLFVKLARGGFEVGRQIIKNTDLIVETFLLRTDISTGAARKTLEDIKKEAEERCEGPGPNADAPAPAEATASNTDDEDAKNTCLSFATHYFLSTMALSEPLNGATETTYPHLAENHVVLRGGVTSDFDTQFCPDAKVMQSFAMDFKSCDKATGKINGPSARVDSRNNLKCEFVMLCTVKPSNEIVRAGDNPEEAPSSQDHQEAGPPMLVHETVPAAIPLDAVD